MALGPLLSILIALPLVGAVALLVVDSRREGFIRAFALGV